MIWWSCTALLGCGSGASRDLGENPLDLDGDGYQPAQNDCDDADRAVHPGAPDAPGDGSDRDCNGTDFATTRLRSTARLIVVGDAQWDALGTSVACSDQQVGDLASAIAVGADQELRPSGVERSVSGGSPGLAVLLDGLDAGTIAAADASWRADGSDDDDELGHRVVFPGDTDADGRGELLVTAGNAYRPATPDEPATQTGAAFLFTPEVSGRVVPEDALTWFVGTWGKHLKGAAPLGDVDSDGLADILLSETNLADPGAGGEVRVYIASSLAPAVLPSAAAVRAPASEPLSPTGEFMTVGEITGDGSADLVLGETEWQPTGRAVIAEGPPLEWSLDEALEVTGTGADASFGHSLAIGDLDADGTGDLAIGAHISSKTGTRRGAAYVFFGPVVDHRTADQADVSLFGEVDHAWMGAGATILDHDGDGLEDLAVAAASDLFYEPHRPGLVYVFPGPLAKGELHPGSAAVIYEGMEGGELLGLRLASCDLDHDGSDDLVVGAPGTAEGLERRGRVFVIDGVEK